ncbi:MAG: alpha/beta hydrolase [Gammaproteobacteria bacterium]|nr:alpha/beta hydrolase [Gammaproteobacteria bacterium]
MPLHVERLGSRGPRLVLVHGSMRAGLAAFSEQAFLADRYQVFIPYRRGYGNNPPITKVDLEVDAQDVLELLGDGAHLVGTSMGGIVSMLAASARPQAVHSLTLIEPPAFPLAVDLPAVAEVANALKQHWASAAPGDLPAFVEGFLRALKYEMKLPSPLPPELTMSIRNLTTEEPWRCDVPIGAVAEGHYTKAVISGDWSEAFTAIADRLAHLIGGERRIIPGANHAVQQKVPEFNDYFVNFLERADGKLN